MHPNPSAWGRRHQTQKEPEQGGRDKQRKTHSLKGGSRVFAPGEGQAAHYRTPNKIKGYGP